MHGNTEQHALRIRPATLEDARLLLDWRNDPLSREQSRNSEEITWESHLSYFTNVVSGTLPSRHLYVVENGAGIPIGTVRSDETEDGYVEISYTVAPEWRGRGIGTAMVIQFAREYLGGKKIRAVIKKGHGPSEAVARALGLSPQEQESNGGADGIPLIIWR